VSQPAIAADSELRLSLRITEFDSRFGEIAAASFSEIGHVGSCDPALDETGVAYPDLIHVAHVPHRIVEGSGSVLTSALGLSAADTLGGHDGRRRSHRLASRPKSFRSVDPLAGDARSGRRPRVDVGGEADQS